MNRGIYAPASGMINNERLLDIVSNNLANASTTGFKGDGIYFKEALEQTMNANGGQGEELGSMGVGPDFGTPYTNMQQGAAKMTGQSTDTMIVGNEGMFAVQTPDGVQYTRDGSFTINSDGVLVNQSGYPVLDSTYHQIDVGQGAIDIGNDGTVSVTMPGKTPDTVGQIAVFTGNFTKLGANNWAGTNTQASSTIQIQSGALEGSNVNPIEEMVNLIRIGRTYELQQKAISQQDELTQKLSTTMN